MIRAFVGIPVPPEARSVLLGAQVGLRVGKLVPEENFHLTLAFLGEHPESMVEDVHDGLSGILAGPVEIKSIGMGTFGDARPRALFADVEGNRPLKDLRKKVRQAVRDYGVELNSERFHPHITLARFGAGLIGEDAVAAGEFMARHARRAEVEFKATSFCLYRSHLGKYGPIYEVLAEYPLSASTES